MSENQNRSHYDMQTTWSGIKQLEGGWTSSIKPTLAIREIEPLGLCGG